MVRLSGSAPSLLPHGKGTILLVEDEDAARGLSSLKLRSAGYTVLEAVDGAAAVQLVEQASWPINLLVTDHGDAAALESPLHVRLHR
jgi:DNA-binding response OmpR family regulator